MRILLTNDDGVLSPVLHRSAESLAAEHEVFVVAPAKDQSGQSHGFTYGPDNPLFCHEETSSPWSVHRVEGTPSDCVKFAVSHLMKGLPPDLVLSGPNLGENAGVSAVYSGTVAAAREAALWGIPALAVSISEKDGPHLDHALDWLLNLFGESGSLPAPGTLWNVNFPACPPGEVAGARFTRMSTVMFRDRYEEIRTPHSIPGFQLLGYKPRELFEQGTDDDALRENFITVTPLQISQTHEAELDRLKSREAWLNALTPPRPAGAPA